MKSGRSVFHHDLRTCPAHWRRPTSLPSLLYCCQFLHIQNCVFWKFYSQSCVPWFSGRL